MNRRNESMHLTGNLGCSRAIHSFSLYDREASINSNVLGCVDATRTARTDRTLTSCVQQGVAFYPSRKKGRPSLNDFLRMFHKDGMANAFIPKKKPALDVRQAVVFDPSVL